MSLPLTPSLVRWPPLPEPGSAGSSSLIKGSFSLPLSPWPCSYEGGHLIIEVFSLLLWGKKHILFRMIKTFFCTVCRVGFLLLMHYFCPPSKLCKPFSAALIFVVRNKIKILNSCVKICGFSIRHRSVKRTLPETICPCCNGEVS